MLQRQRSAQDHGYPAPAVYSGPEAYKELCLRDDIDLVYVCTDWAHHVPVALCAMEHGKHVAVEVPSANSLKECWDLVNTSERTRRHCVILENCCYDFFEMMSLQLAQQGALGEVLHAEGSYHHNLDFYWNQYWEDWRLQFNATHRGDLYPTHGLGPVAQPPTATCGDTHSDSQGTGGEFPPSEVFPDRDRKSQQSPPD